MSLLQLADIDLVADVRTVPRSLMNPQYDRDTLPEAMAESNIAYEHIATLKSAKGAGIADRVADRFTAVAQSFARESIGASRRGQLSQATLTVGASVSLRTPRAM